MLFELLGNFLHSMQSIINLSWSWGQPPQLKTSQTSIVPIILPLLLQDSGKKWDPQMKQNFTMQVGQAQHILGCRYNIISKKQIHLTIKNIYIVVC